MTTPGLLITLTSDVQVVQSVADRSEFDQVMVIDHRVVERNVQLLEIDRAQVVEEQRVVLLSQRQGLPQYQSMEIFERLQSLRKFTLLLFLNYKNCEYSYVEGYAELQSEAVAQAYLPHVVR